MPFCDRQFDRRSSPCIRTRRVRRTLRLVAIFSFASVLVAINHLTVRADDAAPNSAPQADWQAAGATTLASTGPTDPSAGQNPQSSAPPNSLPPGAFSPSMGQPSDPNLQLAPAGIPPANADLSVTSPPGPLTTEVPTESDQARQHPMLERLRQQFGPEPNGNWSNEPIHFDTFLGFIDDRTAENTGVLGGFRFGWDYDVYWGVETRLAFTSLQEDTGPVVIWDESLLYYPWGDSRVRPYLTLGLGITECKIVEPGDWHNRENLVDMPFGFGFKYRIHEWLALRFDFLDNLAFGSNHLGTMNNLSFTTGFEWRFGGYHYNYWPWNPNGGH